MRDAVIVEAVRTPVGRRSGALAGVHPVDLSAHVLRALAERTGLDPGVVDDVVWGCVSQVGEQTFNVGRNAVLAAGWPRVGAGHDDRPAVRLVASRRSPSRRPGVIAGQYDVVVAGGVESMSRVPLGSSPAVSGMPFGEQVLARYAGELAAGHPVFNQGVGAEMIAERWGLSREQLDEFSLESHERAAAATDAGRFAAQIAPVTLPDGTVVDGRRGHPPRRHAGDAGRPEDAVPRGRRDHGGHVLADLRRRRPRC